MTVHGHLCYIFFVQTARCAAIFFVIIIIFEIHAHLTICAVILFLVHEAFTFYEYFYKFLRQLLGVIISNNGNNSRRPASISKISVSLEKSEKNEKLHVGPTLFKPGPILLRVARTAVKLVVKSCPSSDSARVEIPKTMKNTAK